MGSSAFRIFGMLLTVAAIGFVGWELLEHRSQLSGWQPSIGQVAVVVLLPFGYAAALLLLAKNWVDLVRFSTTQPIPEKTLKWSYTSSQIAKYIPGNIFHFAGRHIYLKQFGASHSELGKATVIEIAVLVIGALAAFGLSAVLLIGTGQFQAIKWLAFALLVVLLGALVLFAVFREKRETVLLISVTFRSMAFMLLQGVGFAIIASALTRTIILLATPSAIAAWLVGFVTPGSPGGLGIREVVLYHGLPEDLSDATLVLSIVLWRIITVLGDIILYLFGLWAFPEIQNP